MTHLMEEERKKLEKMYQELNEEKIEIKKKGAISFFFFNHSTYLLFLLFKIFEV